MGIVEDGFRRAAAAGDQGEEDFTVTLESPQDPNKWVQLRFDMINISYPWKTEPIKELKRRGFPFPRSFDLCAWEAGTFATFAHGGEPLAELVAFVERYAREVLGVEPSELVFTVPTDD
jgi:hypothetical protein